MVQVPVVTNTALVPETVQTEVVNDAKLTAKPELDDALSVSELPTTWLAIALNVMVWLARLPVPLKGIVCLAGLPLRELSVSTTELEMDPSMVGAKLMLRLQ